MTSDLSKLTDAELAALFKAVRKEMLRRELPKATREIEKMKKRLTTPTVKN